MGELTINIRYDRGDEVFDIDIEAYAGDDYKQIDDDLYYDKEFQDLLQALGERFVQIVDDFEAETANLK